jgi:hypothetical protein
MVHGPVGPTPWCTVQRGRGNVPVPPAWPICSTPRARSARSHAAPRSGTYALRCPPRPPDQPRGRVVRHLRPVDPRGQGTQVDVPTSRRHGVRPGAPSGLFQRPVVLSLVSTTGFGLNRAPSGHPCKSTTERWSGAARTGPARPTGRRVKRADVYLPQSARERRKAGVRPPAPPFLDPPRDQFRVSPGLAAQRRGLTLPQVVRIGEALQSPGDLGQQISPAVRQLAEAG